MPTPVQTQILDEIGNRLAVILTSNGYFTDVNRIARARLQPFKNREMPAVNYYATGVAPVKPLMKGVTHRTLSMVIEYYALTRDETFIDLANKMSTDIEIALDRDVNAPAVSDPVSNRLGGLVSGIEITSITPAIGEGQTPFCGVVILLNVTYGVSRADPFILIT